MFTLRQFLNYYAENTTIARLRIELYDGYGEVLYAGRVANMPASIDSDFYLVTGIRIYEDSSHLNLGVNVVKAIK